MRRRDLAVFLADRLVGRQREMQIKAAVLGVSAQITSIRPALIVACLLQEAEPEISPEASQRFFEAGWREHPCGTHGAPLLGALALTARAHGGRVDVKLVGKGCLVTFVVPRLEG